MPIAPVQSTGAQASSGGTTLAKAYASNVGSGNLLLCLAVGTSISAPTFTVSGSVNGSFTSAVRLTLTGLAVELFYKKNATAGAETITVTANNNSTLAMGISEYTGADTAAPLLGSATDSGTGTSADAGTPLGGSLEYGGVGLATVSGGTITTTGSGTQRFNVAASSTMVGVATQDVTNASPVNMTWTLGASVNWVGVSATFAAAPPTMPLGDTPGLAQRPPPSRYFLADRGVGAEPWETLLPLPVGPPTVMPPDWTDDRLFPRPASRNFRPDPGADPCAWITSALATQPPPPSDGWNQPVQPARRVTPPSRGETVLRLSPGQQDTSVTLAASQESPFLQARKPAWAPARDPAPPVPPIPLDQQDPAALVQQPRAWQRPPAFVAVGNDPAVFAVAAAPVVIDAVPVEAPARWPPRYAFVAAPSDPTPAPRQDVAPQAAPLLAQAALWVKPPPFRPDTGDETAVLWQEAFLAARTFADAWHFAGARPTPPPAQWARGESVGPIAPPMDAPFWVAPEPAAVWWKRPAFVAAPTPSDLWQGEGVITVQGPYAVEAADLYCAGVVVGDILGGSCC